MTGLDSEQSILVFWNYHLSSTDLKHFEAMMYQIVNYSQGAHDLNDLYDFMGLALIDFQQVDESQLAKFGHIAYNTPPLPVALLNVRNFFVLAVICITKLAIIVCVWYKLSDASFNT